MQHFKLVLSILSFHFLVKIHSLFEVVFFIWLDTLLDYPHKSISNEINSTKTASTLWIN